MTHYGGILAGGNAKPMEPRLNPGRHGEILTGDNAILMDDNRILMGNNAILTDYNAILMGNYAILTDF